MWHRKNDQLANPIRVVGSREPCHSGSPVVSDNVRHVDTERVENAEQIGNRVLPRICRQSFRTIGAPEPTQVRRDDAEAVRDKKWNLVAPQI